MKDDGGLSILVGIDRALKVGAGACVKLCTGIQRRSGVTRYGNIGAYLVLYNGEADFYLMALVWSAWKDMHEHSVDSNSNLCSSHSIEPKYSITHGTLIRIQVVY